MTKDLTERSLIKNIAVFSLPFLLSYFLQTLYGMADLFIVGQFNGASSISGVSIGSQVMHMITVMLVGVCMGTIVTIGRYVGLHEEKSVSKVIGNSITLFAVISAVLLIVLLVMKNTIVTIMGTPTKAVNETGSYLFVCFLGIPFIVAYNVIASIFRGLGDSKTPMFFIAVTCIVNIVMDYFFIGILGLKATGAAFGTIIAQAFSVAVSLFAIYKKKLITVKKEDLKLDKRYYLPILKTGVPVALQDGLIQISFLIITVIANARGVEVSAAVGIVEKIISFLFLVPSSMLSTVSTIASQAIGANKKELAIRTLFTCMTIGGSIGLAVAIALQFVAEPVLGLFTNEENVIALGSTYIHSYVFDCVIACCQFCFSGFFVACGYSSLSFIQNIVSIIVCRVPGAYLASVYFPDTLFPMGMAAPMGGVLQICICVYFFRKLRKEGKI